VSEPAAESLEQGESHRFPPATGRLKTIPPEATFAPVTKGFGHPETIKLPAYRAGLAGHVPAKVSFGPEFSGSILPSIFQRCFSAARLCLGPYFLDFRIDPATSGPMKKSERISDILFRTWTFVKLN